MALKVGSKVTIKKNLGPKNNESLGEADNYYFPDAYNTDETPLGCKGTVTRIDGEKIWVKVTVGPHGDEMYDDEYPFHKSELSGSDGISDTGLGKLPTAKVITLAAKMPVFIINERVYTLGEVSEKEENFYHFEKKGASANYSLVESATLSSLEKLAMKQHAKQFDKLQEEYLQGIFEEGEVVGDSDKRYVLLDFIANKVFPYLRGNGGDDEKLAKLLGVKTVKKPSVKQSEQAEEPKEEPAIKKKEDPLIKKIVKEIEKEKLHEQEKKVKPSVAKLDALLGFEPESAPTGPDYVPESNMGKALGGRNAVIVKGNVFYLAPAAGVPGESYVNIDGKNFVLVSEEKVADLKVRHDFELSKQVRIDALKVKYAEQKKIGQLKDSGNNLEALLKKKSYQEGDFGFIATEPSSSGVPGPTYWVFIQVPEHVLKMPEDEQRNYSYDNYGKKVLEFYHFGPVRLAVRVYFGINGKITYDAYPVTVERYTHPFAGMSAFDRICMGTYNRSKLSGLDEGEAIARLLVDAKKTMTSGYTRGVSPLHRLHNLPSRAITPAEIKKRKLQVTNININNKF